MVPVLAIWAFLRQAVAVAPLFSDTPEFTNAAFLLDAYPVTDTSIPLHAWRSYSTLAKWFAAAAAAFVVPVVAFTAWGILRLQADALARDVVPDEAFFADQTLHAIARAVNFIPGEAFWALFRCALALAFTLIENFVDAANLIPALANTSGSIIVHKAVSASVWR